MVSIAEITEQMRVKHRQQINKPLSHLVRTERKLCSKQQKSLIRTLKRILLAY
jgi:hypothetical protein